jgi:sec-independent protein translocase protein TatB
MFGQFGWGEMLLLILVGLFVFGPERLPTIMRDAGRVVRQFRDTARGMRDELQAELGPEMADLDLKSLNPRTLVEQTLLGDDDEDEAPVAPKPRLEKRTSSDGAAKPQQAAAQQSRGPVQPLVKVQTVESADPEPAMPPPEVTVPPEATPFDADAT